MRISFITEPLGIKDILKGLSSCFTLCALVIFINYVILQACMIVLVLLTISFCLIYLNIFVFLFWYLFKLLKDFLCCFLEIETKNYFLLTEYYPETEFLLQLWYFLWHLYFTIFCKIKRRILLFYIIVCFPFFWYQLANPKFFANQGNLDRIPFWKFNCESRFLPMQVRLKLVKVNKLPLLISLHLNF